MGTVIYDKTGGYTGFLGNVLFQTAATIGIAIKNNMDYKFPFKEYFNAFSRQIPIDNNCKNLITQDYTEKNYHYDDVVLDPTQNYNLNGYFQTKKYWEHCEPLIREMFTFTDASYVANTSQIKTSINDVTLHQIDVCVHVRRGDYLVSPECHPTLTVDYYNEAAKKISDDLAKYNRPIRFIVFSNDFDWCRENFNNNPLFPNVGYMTGNTPEMDLYYMSLCDHHIIANSSMSWWGSYLCKNDDKIIYAPSKDKWYGEKYKDWNLNDMYRDGWKLI